MHSLAIFRKVHFVLFFAVIVFVLTLTQIGHTQTLRNPVLEYATGTWCPYCPIGHGVIRDEILPDRKSTRLNSSHIPLSRMPSSA